LVNTVLYFQVTDLVAERVYQVFIFLVKIIILFLSRIIFLCKSICLHLYLSHFSSAHLHISWKKQLSSPLNLSHCHSVLPLLHLLTDISSFITSFKHCFIFHNPSLVHLSLFNTTHTQIISKPRLKIYEEIQVSQPINHLYTIEREQFFS
jgi:hypothetical protein